MYRVAIIGHTGRGDYGHGIDTVWQKLPKVEVVGVSDPDPKGLEAAIKRSKAPKGFADYRQMLDETKPQIVAIGPRHIDQHRDFVVAAAERGCHIYMEKPLCRTPREADEMVAACEKHKVKLAIAMQTRYSPKLQVVRDLIADGKLGTILECRGRGKEDARGGGEDLWVLGTHIFNLIDHLVGNPKWCFAQVEQAGRPIGPSDIGPAKEGIGVLAGDYVAAMYGLDSGATAYFNSRRSMGGTPSRFALQIFGSKGQLEILTGHLPAWSFLADPAWSPGRSKAQWQPISSAGVGVPEPLKEGGLDAGNVLACMDLIDAIEDDRQPEANIYEGRTTVEMITAVFASAKAKGPVTMPLADRESPLASWK